MPFQPVRGQAVIRRSHALSLASCLRCCWSGCLYATPANAAEITFTSVLTPNSDLQVSIEILGVEDLLAFDFGVNFNPAAMLLQVDEGNFLSGETGVRMTAFGSFQDPADATLLRLIGGVFSLSGAVGISGGTLAVLLFSGITAADLDLTFTLSLPGENLGFLDSGFNFIDVAPLDTSPNPIPEPSTLGLFGLGLWAIRRRLTRRA